VEGDDVKSSAGIPEGPKRRLAVGVVAPFDLELDAELWRWLPDGVDLLMTRTPYVDDAVTVEFALEISDEADLQSGVRSVIAGRADTVVYACTSASFVRGRAGEAALRDAMLRAGARAALTTSGAIVEALGALGARRVSVATPYLPELSAYLDGFLGEHGVEVLRHDALGLDHEIWEVDYARTAELIRAVDHPDAGAIVVSCTNLPSYDLIAPLERELGKPIVSANQATMWAVLRELGLAAVGPGQHLIGA
jgi:maleate isomerase